ncbi:hypothetical protein [Sanguibacter sp. 25GB23B1]|uniref:hypothetical protein n=1 Tax=unclassified Sanguibacter TaxID=2645534 RepID=UPI0032AF1EA7
MRPARAVSLPRVLASEWTKVTSVGSTVWTALGVVLTAAGVAVGLGMFVRVGDGTSGVSLVVSGVVVAQLAALVLGVLVGTADYATGSSTTTYTAVPRRLPVLAAQTLLTAAVAVVTAVVALGAAVLVTVAQRDATGLALLETDGSSRALVGFVAYLTAVALLGLAAGALLRSPAAALVGGVVLLVVLDQVLAANPGRVADTARALLPGVGARLVRDDAQLASVEAASLGPHLGAWGAGLVLAAWVLGLLVVAAVRLRTDDVLTGVRR